MFTWARIEQEGVDAAAAVAAARAEGLAIVPGNEFSVDGGYDRDLRLSYSTLTPTELVEAVGLLRAAFDRLVLSPHDPNRSSDRAERAQSDHRVRFGETLTPASSRGGRRRRGGRRPS